MHLRLPLTSGVNDEVMIDSYYDGNYKLISIQEQEMTKKNAVYKSFLLRICTLDTRQIQQVKVTRISEDGEQLYFSNLDDLMIFLLQETEDSAKGELPLI